MWDKPSPSRLHFLLESESSGHLIESKPFGIHRFDFTMMFVIRESNSTQCFTVQTFMMARYSSTLIHKEMSPILFLLLMSPVKFLRFVNTIIDEKYTEFYMKTRGFNNTMISKII
ncbi:hypothetical protein L1987_44972 [Smallanthus sonchifolius]|uniref:Uncharacterized protein n=1 Tax=Smallanthus sonchifolius TaxID=185202 RepID=A0ACB9GS39_9ASTR|nr:hypothetical protein L1987_44972 [Smallanthus sonchifolius]